MPSSTADVLNAALISPNVPDSNGEPANVVDVLHHLACAATRLADAWERIATVVEAQTKKNT